MSYDYTYYANGLKHTFTGPDGQTLTYFYDAGNRFSNISIPGQGNITYNTYHWNRPYQMILPGGGNSSYEYDPLMQIKNITAKDPAQNAVMLRDYTYASSGNITQKATEHGIYGYEYDDLYRLTGAVNPTLPDEAYTYDKLGNRLTSAQTTGNWTYNANNELQGYDDVSFEYDANGNTTRKVVGSNDRRFTFDIEDRLSEVRNGSDTLIASYYYDPFGRRLWKDVDGTRRYFLYADEGLVGEYNINGTEIKTYGYVPDSQYSTNPIFVKESGIYYFYQNDAQGTPQKITATNGSVVWSATYDSFGNCQIDIETIVNNLRMPGQYFDAETGLHYNLKRYYDSDTGRYLQADPYGQGLNLYAYVFSNPVNLIDPVGLCAINAVGQGVENVWDLWSDLVTIDFDKIIKYMGTEAGDIFTIGVTIGWWVGTGISFDRVVMPNGEADWFFTWGAGASIPGFSVGFDRGKIGKIDMLNNKDSRFYVNSDNLSKDDIKGFSLSSGADLYVVGGEVVLAPFTTNAVKSIEYPTPLVTVKGGLRVGIGANIFGNWTWDIGD